VFDLITRFQIGCSHTVNLGNFNSIRVECSLTVDVPEGDDYQVLADKAQKELRELLEETWRRQRNPDGAK
jgi:hypothetical protein